jgi:hypothetical protein
MPSTDRAKRGMLAGSTGLEPAASGVTGRRSNQLNYDPERDLCGPPYVKGGSRKPSWLASRSSRSRLTRVSEGWWAVQDSNL